MTGMQLLAGLAGYWVQVAVLVGVCLPLPWLLKVRNPGVRFAFLYGVLAAVLCLPLLPSLELPVASTGKIPDISIATSVSGVLSSMNVGSYGIPLISAVLGAVALVRLLMLVFGYGVLCRYRRDSRELGAIPVGSGWGRLHDGIPIGIGISERVKTPLSFGLKRPTILLPVQFLELEEEQQRNIISHEQIHLERRDWIFIVFEQCVQALFWFHPALYMLIDRIDLCREQLIDREVVRRSGARTSYLRTLYAVAKTFRQTSVAPAIPFLLSGHLKQRVAQLKQEVFMSKSRCVFTLSMLFLVLAGTGLTASSAIRFAPASAAVAGLPVAALQQEAPLKGEEKPPDGKIQLKDDVDVKVRLVKQTNPSYPEEAKKEGITGEVLLEAKIGKDGKVIDVTVRQSVHKLLDKAAADAVKQWEYTPPVRDGKPVEVTATIKVAFKLQ